ncbi:hypothetical protein APY03_1689 [Variovorax sp. WDL1]|nr:hypothetical protein APY03_1689 [Variovorax sp. WDL1]
MCRLRKGARHRQGGPVGQLFRSGRRLTAGTESVGRFAEIQRPAVVRQPVLPAADATRVGAQTRRRSACAIARGARAASSQALRRNGRANRADCHGGPLPRSGRCRAVLGQPLRGARFDQFLRRCDARCRRQCSASSQPELCAGARRDRGCRVVRRRLFRHQSQGSAADGSAAAPVPGDLLGVHGACGLHAGPVPWLGRRLRRHEQRHLLSAACSKATRSDRGTGPLPGDARQREGLHRDARGPPPELERTGDRHPHRVLDLARCRDASVPCAALRSVRRSTGRWDRNYMPPAQRLPLRGGRHAVTRRPYAQLRRQGAGHGVRRWRGRGHAQAIERRTCRWRPHLRRAARRSRQQRRWRQSQLHGTQRRRPGGRHLGSAGVGRRGCAQHLVRRNPRHGHADGRPGRSRGPDTGLRAPHVGYRLLPHRLGQEQCRPPGHRSRHRRADQDGLGTAHRTHPRHGSLHCAQSGHPL